MAPGRSALGACGSGILVTVGKPIDDVLLHVGSRLRELRRQRGVTLTEMAVRAGTSQSTLSRLEGGQRTPTLELLLPLARVWGASRRPRGGTADG